MKPVNEHTEGEQNSVLPLRECPDCDSTDSRLEYAQQSFRYGRGDEAVDLTCEVPVYTCNKCGYQWTRSEAEDLRQIAVCQHLGRLTPNEVRGVRERFGLSQAEFSRITGFGEASLSRWETGAQVQSASNDRLLRLIQADPRTLHRLTLIAEANDHRGDPTFRVITITPELRRRKASFRLFMRAAS
jgi:putative zinc finger/helix-turn-helix YgiT family protein